MKQNIAVVGAGFRGRGLARVLNRLGVLYAVCDSEPHLLDALCLGDGVKRTADLDRLLGDPEVTGFIVATPGSNHYGITWDALDAGKDVMVEPPMAHRVADAEELVRLAARNDRILMVGHLLRFHPAMLKLQELASAGELGRIEHVYAGRLSTEKLRGEDASMREFAPNDVSCILALLSRPLAVTSRRLPDVTLTSIEFTGNTRAEVSVSWRHPIREQRLVVVGSRQIAVFEDTRPSDKLVLHPRRVEWHGGIVPVAVKGEGTPVALPDDDPLELECRHFLESCATRAVPRTDGREGLAVLRAMAAAEESAQSGRAVRAVSSTRPRVRHTDRRPVIELTPFFVHPTAMVEPGSAVGAGTKAWHRTRISCGARIGRNCVFGQDVLVDAGAVTGDNCVVQDRVTLPRGVTLESDVLCGPSVVFSAPGDADRTLVKQGATIGTRAAIAAGSTLGRCCRIEPGAAVDGIVPDFALMAGAPALRIGWVCRCGVELAVSVDRVSCRQCGAQYEIAGECVSEAERRPFSRVTGPDRRPVHPESRPLALAVSD